MEDKRTAIAILVCMFVLMFYMEWVMAPYNRRPTVTTQATPQSQQPGATGQLQLQAQPLAPGQSVANAKNQSAKPPTTAQLQEAGINSFEAQDYLLSISNLGARIASFKLKHYKASLAKEELLDLVTPSDGIALPMGVYVADVNDSFVQYKLENPLSRISAPNATYSLQREQETQLRFSGTLPNGTGITKIFTVSPASYLLKVDVELTAPVGNKNPLWLEWTHFDSHYETNQRLDTYYYTLLGADNKVKLIQITEVLPALTQLGPQLWATFGDKYFMSTLISLPNAANVEIAKDGNLYLTRISGTEKSGSFHAFLGPKSHSDLEKTGYQLERNVDLGIFSFVALPLLTGIKFLYSLLGNYGLAIILLTLIIKSAFLPLTQKSFKSMQAMQALQPEMKALKERIQDPTKLNQEVMGLYKKHGVNPMGGCFPMLIQLPVFLGLYNTLNYSLELRHAPFALWIKDLSSPEHLDVFGIGIPVMVLLMGSSMFIQQMTTPSAADPQQKKIMLMMPIIMTVSFMIFPMPSGLVLYWLVNNLISIIQQMSLHSKKSGGALKGTVIASVAIFCVGYILTLI